MTPETTLDLQQLASREDVLSVLSQVERSIGLLRVHADEEAQRAAESERLSREFASLEDERARLLERQCALESQLAAARGTLSEFERRVRDAEACASDANRRAQNSLEECARIEGEALSLALAHDQELKHERETQREAFATRAEELERAFDSRVAELEQARAVLEAQRAELEQQLVDREQQRANLEEQRAQLEQQRAQLEHELADRTEAGLASDGLAAELHAVRSELDTLRAAHDARGHDDQAMLAAAEARCGALESELAETRAALAAMESRAADLVARVSEYAARISECTARLHAQEAREAELDARIEQYSAREAASNARADATAERLAAVEAELCAERARHAACAAEETAAGPDLDGSRDEGAPFERTDEMSALEEDSAREADSALDEAARAEAFANAVELRAGEIAEERLQQALAPKLAGLAQAAAFLRTRKARLAALRSGLKRRARELKAEREALLALPAPGFETTERGGGEALDAGAAELASVRAERAALASEKQEIVDLRTILEASEASLARRAAGTRITTTVALSLGFSAVAALASWHLAGALSPTPALAQVELAVSSRAPEAQQRGAASEASADVAEAGSTASSNQGARIEQWIDARVADESFAGVVAGRLLDRGRTRAESDALAASFVDRLSVESSDSTVRLALRGDGLEQTSATLDAIATSIVTEANRDPARRSDFLRVGIANAKQEIGRTVFAHAEPLPDPERLARAGGFFGGFLAVAAVVVGVFAIFTRRAAALATQGY